MPLVIFNLTSPHRWYTLPDYVCHYSHWPDRFFVFMVAEIPMITPTQHHVINLTLLNLHINHTPQILAIKTLRPVYILIIAISLY